MNGKRLALRTVALGYLALLLVAPVGLVFYRTFEHGFAAAWNAVTTPAAEHAFWLTIEVVAMSPLTITGMATRVFTSAIVSYSAWPSNMQARVRP